MRKREYKSNRLNVYKIYRNFLLVVLLYLSHSIPVAHAQLFISNNTQITVQKGTILTDHSGGSINSKPEKTHIAKGTIICNPEYIHGYELIHIRESQSKSIKKIITARKEKQTNRSQKVDIENKSPDSSSKIKFKINGNTDFVSALSYFEKSVQLPSTYRFYQAVFNESGNSSPSGIPTGNNENKFIRIDTEINKNINPDSIRPPPI